jgi:hypothetical protein
LAPSLSPLARPTAPPAPDAVSRRAIAWGGSPRCRRRRRRFGAFAASRRTGERPPEQRSERSVCDAERARVWRTWGLSSRADLNRALLTRRYSALGTHATQNTCPHAPATIELHGLARHALGFPLVPPWRDRGPDPWVHRRRVGSPRRMVCASRSTRRQDQIPSLQSTRIAPDLADSRAASWKVSGNEPPETKPRTHTSPGLSARKGSS